MSFGALDELARRPDAAVLIVHVPADLDGADQVDAARRAYGAMVTIPLKGHTARADALQGRDVVLWPWRALDAERARLSGLEGDLSRTCSRLRVIAAHGVVDDCLGPADLNGHDPVGWAKAHAHEVLPQPTVDLDQEWFGGDLPIEETHDRVADWTPPAAMLDEWPEPVDIFETVPVPALAHDLLPWPIADFVFDQSALMGTDPGILGLSALVTLASCTDDAIQAQPKQHEYRWRESARLWGAIVAGPAEKKSPPIRRATSHLKQIDMKLAEEVSNRLRNYELERAIYERRRNLAKGNPIQDEPPDRPKERCLMIDDATTEVIGKILRDNPRGLFLLRDELSGWFGSLDAYSGAQGKDAAFFLECYEGGPGKVNRITRDAGPIPNKSLCILGGIQPDPMRKIANRLNEDGLLQRFMIVCPNAAAGLGEDRVPDRAAEARYHGLIDGLLALRGDRERPVAFSAGARAILVEVSEAVAEIAKRPETSARMRVHLGKWQGLFVRLAVLYHATEAAALAQDYAGSDVSRGTAENVRRLMLDYLLPHLTAFYDNVLDQSATVEHARWIAGYILARDAETVSDRDIARSYRPWRGLWDRDRTDVWRVLVQASWLNIRGRGWAVNPAVHARFADRAEAEKKRRASILASIEHAVEKRRRMNEH